MADLLIDFGNIAPSQPIDVNLQGPSLSATYAGKVFKDSSEYAGVRLAIGIDDPLWQVFSKPGELVLQAENLVPVTIPLQERRVRYKTFSRPVGRISPPLTPLPHRNRIVSIAMTVRMDRDCRPVMTTPDPIPWRMYPMPVKPKSH